MKIKITKIKDEWVNTPPKGFDVKFERYPTGKDSSLLYKWDFEILDDELKKEAGFDMMFYGGYHKDNFDLYALSCDLPIANKLIIAPPSKVRKTLHILDWGSEDEMKGAEWEYLDVNNAVKDKQWLNQQNNFGKGKFRKPTMTKIEKLSRDWYILKNGLTHRKDELTYHTFDDIKPPRPAMDFHPDNMKNLQPRNVSEYQDLITQIQFLIDKAIEDGRPTTEGAKPIVVLKDREWQGKHYDELLACGKHTSKAFITHKHANVENLSWIEVGPNITDNFTDIELLKAANEDNQPENSVKPITKEDIIKELKIQVEMGGEWNTPEEKSRADRLLRKDSWGSITKSMERWENDVDRANKGLSPRINWQSKEKKLEVAEMAKKAMKENSDTWYNPTPYSSESLTYDTNIIKPWKVWHLDNNVKNPPTKIVNYIYHSYDNSKTKFEKERGLKELIYSWCNERPDLDIDYILLHEYEEDIII